MKKKLWTLLAAMVMCAAMFAVGVSAETVNVTTVDALQSAHPYTDNMDKTWVYTHSANAGSMKVKFSSDTATESNYDYIYIYDGNGTEIGRYTGTSLAGKTVEVPGRTVKIRLTSDRSYTGYGFRITEIMVGSVTVKSIQTTTVAGLQSPHNYANNTDTTWVYTHPTKVEWLKITFSSDTATERNYDYIYIYDGNGTQIRKYSGTSLAGKTVIVQGHIVKIRLTSNGGSTEYGFQVTEITEMPNPFDSGTGTEADPYQIATLEQLIFLKDSVNNGISSYIGQYIKLTADIELNDTTTENWTATATRWSPIGTESYPFSGTFDGNNHSISGMYIQGNQYAGLFGYTHAATFKNLYIENSEILVEDGHPLYVGGIVGYCESNTSFTNCHNAATITATLDPMEFSSKCAHAGGIVGYCASNTTFLNCSNSGNISAISHKSCSTAGGIVGRCSGDASFIHCINNSDIISQVIFTSHNSYAGGIVGECLDSDTIQFLHCKNYGNISSYDIRSGNYDGTYSGGIVGYCQNTESITLQYCCNMGTVSAYKDTNGSWSGGIIGYSKYANTTNIQYCYNSGAIIGDYWAGGIAGSLSGTSVTIDSCYNSGTCTGNGIIRSYGDECSISRCYSVGVSNKLALFETDDWSDATIQHCYYLVGTGLEDSMSTTTPLTDVQMQQQESFYGFDFSSVWTMGGEPSYPYPELIGMNHPVMSPPLYTLSGTISSAGTGDITLSLLLDNVPVEGIRITVDNATGVYSITNVPAGTYTLRVSKPKHVTREYTVTLGEP